MFKGIEFVRLSQLPADLLRQITDWLSPAQLIKIRGEGFQLDDCLQYREYDYWFTYCFSGELYFELI